MLKKFKKIKILTFLIVGLLLLTSFSMISIAQEDKPIMFEQVTENPPARSMWIGALIGTWKEMGVQYGERAASDIRRTFDMKWKGTIAGTSRWRKNLTAEEKAKYTVAYIESSYKEMSYLSPEVIEFVQGVAEGAAQELNKSEYADVCSNFTKIAFLSFAGVHFAYEFPGAGINCNGFYVKGEATKTGETYATGTDQDAIVDDLDAVQIACVFVPKDPNARVFSYLGTAGVIGGTGCGMINDLGLAVVMSGAQYDVANEQWEDTLAPGVKDSTLAFYGVAFSKTAREAAERVTIGTPKYREITGRKTLLRARGANIMFMDVNEAYCVEQNAFHYAIRRPGYLGEKGNNFIVNANDFQYKDGSYDENNIWNPDEPMTKYTPQEEGSGTYYRFWSGMWELINNYGKIDREMMLRELATSHNAYDKEGNKIDPDPVTGEPTVSTFCTHSGERSETYPLGTGGNNKTTVFVLNTAEVYWVPAFPCSYIEKSWNYLDLKPYAEYRKLLWNIE